MCKGHLDAQNYRLDFVEVLLNEMIEMHGGTKSPSEEGNEAKMKGLFDGN